jgi:hypothetical protein
VQLIWSGPALQRTMRSPGATWDPSVRERGAPPEPVWPRSAITVTRMDLRGARARAVSEEWDTRRTSADPRAKNRDLDQM